MLNQKLHFMNLEHLLQQQNVEGRLTGENFS